MESVIEVVGSSAFRSGEPCLAEDVQVTASEFECVLVELDRLRVTLATHVSTSKAKVVEPRFRIY